MQSFSDYSAWGVINVVAILLLSMIIANLIKKSIKFLKNSLIPTSVLAGLLLLIFAIVYEKITGNNLFDEPFFSITEDFKGSSILEAITYHALALGFIASALKPAKRKFSKERSREIFDSGVTTVATYLLQAVLGLGLTIVYALIVTGFFPAAGVLLPFGFGQGTGQAMNFGSIYETATEYTPFVGGKSFGLTIASLGFIAASIGGVIHLNISRKRENLGRINTSVSEKLTESDISNAQEESVNGSIDKLTVQFALIFLAYGITFALMKGLSWLIPSMKDTIFGFNFLLGVIIASIIKGIMGKMKSKNIIKRIYVNDYLMNRISGFCFDLMVIAGVAAIRIDVIKNYVIIILILAVVGTLSTYFYNRFIARKLFKSYSEEQFLVMYGMLTGTASTGIILLRELDKDFSTPAADNLVYQQIPAIAFGFPLMLLGTFAPKNPNLTLIFLFVFFIVMNIILFRSFIFRKKKKPIENK